MSVITRRLERRRRTKRAFSNLDQDISIISIHAAADRGSGPSWTNESEVKEHEDRR